MIDRTLRHYELFMVHQNLGEVLPLDLPDGFRMETYSGPEDIEDWVNIELSSGDVLTEIEAHDAFDRYFGRRLDEIGTEMFFAVDETSGRKVATATGGTRECPFLPAIRAELQWVAVHRDFQGQGLAKPLVSKAMRRMLSAGHTAAWLHSQTRSWLACSIYQQLGWRRHPGTNQEGYDNGWPIVDEEIRKRGRSGCLHELPEVLDKNTHICHTVHMKRVTWIPVVVSAVLLLIAGPVLAGDVLGFSRSASSVAPSSGSADMSGFGEYDGLDDALGRAGGQGQCESEIENPF